MSSFAPDLESIVDRAIGGSWDGASFECHVQIGDLGRSHLVGPGVPGRVQIGSISKVITALICCSAHADGLLQLSDPIHQPDGTPTFLGSVPDISYESILRHRTGLGIVGYPGLPRSVPTPSIEEVIAGHGVIPPLRYVDLPLRRTRYSSGAFALLEYSLERQLGAPFEELVRRLESRLEIDRTFESDRALDDSAEDRGWSGWVCPHVPVPNGSLALPATASSGLWAPPAGILAMLRALSRVIRCNTDTFSDVVRSSYISTAGTSRMGLSVLVDQLRDRTRLRQRGTTDGFNCEFLSYPFDDVHIVAATNLGTAEAALTQCIDSLDNNLWGRTAVSRPAEVAIQRLGNTRHRGEHLRVQRRDDLLEVLTRWGKPILVRPRSPGGDTIVLEQVPGGGLQLRYGETELALDPIQDQ